MAALKVSTAFTGTLALILMMCVQDSIQADELVAEGFFVMDKKSLDLYLAVEGNDQSKAEAALLEDIEFYITDANFYYDTLLPYGLDIQIKIVGLQLLDYDIVDSKDVYNGNDVNPDKTLDTFSDWLASSEPDFSPDEYDFAALFTGYNIEDPVAGVAFTGSMCRDNAHTVLEVNGLPIMAQTFSHELGHIFGASHDRSGEHVMAASNDYGSKNLDRYSFSSESADYIADYLDLSDPDGSTSDCLYDTASSSRDPAITPEVYEGNMQDANYLCSTNYGDGSSVCTADNFYEDGLSSDSVCLRLACHLPDEPEYCSFLMPAEGMPCGPGQSCRKGYCEEDSREELQDVDAECIFGDDLQPKNDYPGYDCEEIIAEIGPGYCESYLDDVCCETCPTYYTGIEGCEWGDSPEFTLAGVEGTTCDTGIEEYGVEVICDQIYDYCCETCPTYYTGIEGCEWGDKKEFTLSGVEGTTCDMAFDIYGSATVCGQLYDYCCESCYNLGY